MTIGREFGVAASITMRAFGDDALLAEAPTTADVMALADALSDQPPGVVDVVPAARTVLVTYDPTRIETAAVRAWMERASEVAQTTEPVRSAATGTIDIPTQYDGPDVDAAAAALGITSAQLIDDHTRVLWQVAFTGFAPGFGYLVSPEWPHSLPRLASPRTRVPAGSVALADGYSGIYPRATPGGWQLIGSTAVTLFDPHATPAALLAPGARVRFIPSRGSAS